MSDDKIKLWERFQKYYFEFPSLGMRLDLSRMQFEDDLIERMQPRLDAALDEMEALEAGAIANKDENRMVGHYWLRNPALAPSPQIRQEIESTVTRIKEFAEDVHSGKIRGERGQFKNILVIGIGGSCLGPQFVANALGHPKTNRLTPYFFDNTDSDGMERVLATIGEGLGTTLCIVISKSGGTQETRNGMMEAMAAYANLGFEFRKHAIAITREDSELHKSSVANSWLCSFPMWDWVGGRTSELSAVGLLPAALQGLDIDAMLSGAKQCDSATRNRRFRENPASQLASMWFHAGNGNGLKNMVVLPYRDRLEVLSKYLQQLIMESIGKRFDRDGRQVCQGLTVFGNKGATDQHSYVQQLRDGANDFFVLFLQVLKSSRSSNVLVDGESSSDDYLAGFFLGTRQALTEGNRESVSLIFDEVTSFSIGAVIALFERAVGIYASLIGVNAYHQPGVEAGKAAAAQVLALQRKVISTLKSAPGTTMNASEIATRIGNPASVEHVFSVAERLAMSGKHGINRLNGGGPNLVQFAYLHTEVVR